MVKIGVYGSLKEGYGNHPLIQGAEKLGETTVKGKMTLVYRSYPQLHLTDEEGASEHVLEVYKVDDEVYSRCRMMELGAGYDEETISTDFGKVIIWVFNDESRMTGEPIEAYNKAVLAA